MSQTSYLKQPSITDCPSCGFDRVQGIAMACELNGHPDRTMLLHILMNCRECETWFRELADRMEQLCC